MIVNSMHVYVRMPWSDAIEYIMETGNMEIRIMFVVLSVVGILTAIIPDANRHSPKGIWHSDPESNDANLYIERSGGLILAVMVTLLVSIFG